ncbi:putative insulysin [Rosa chinensis]|uniref:Putative insulysin n=1 Tax=Rosa chinensis TaxID=74649 RepID=A0A2P6SC53_ROSCH|nr:putative insulysin [Rosa chinensis]
MGSIEFPNENEFFVSPLVKNEAMEQEVQAADSGNKKSLSVAMEKGINLREQILKLYTDYYHGELMKLVVIGGEDQRLMLENTIKHCGFVSNGVHKSLDVLENWVLELFGNVKKGPPVNLEFKAEGPIWKAGKLYRLEAIKDVHILHLTWTLPCLRQDYLKKSEDYLSHLLGHATSLAAGVGDDGMHHSFLAYVFRMDIHLTDSGLDKIFDIIGLVYRYIKLLHQVSPQQWIFKELQDTGNMDFRFTEEQPQMIMPQNLQEVSHRWFFRVIPCNFIICDSEWTMISLSMYMLTHAISICFLDFRCEPWFGSHYIEEDISPSLIDLWKDPPEIDVSLHLPEKNEFIPTDFSICSDGLDTTNTASPRCLLDEPSASVAKLETLVSVSTDRLELRVYGFNDKLPALLSKILKTTKSFMPISDRFMPLSHSTYLRVQVLFQRLYDVDEKLHILSGLSISDVKSFIPQLWSKNYFNLLSPQYARVYIEGLCHGNLSEKEAIRLSDIFKTNFGVQPLPIELMHSEQCICLPPANLIRDVSVKNKTKEQLGYTVHCGPWVTCNIFGFYFYVQSAEYIPICLQGTVENFINRLEELLQ